MVLHMHKLTDRLFNIVNYLQVILKTVAESLAHFNETIVSSQSKLALLVNLPSSYLFPEQASSSCKLAQLLFVPRAS